MYTSPYIIIFRQNVVCTLEGGKYKMKIQHGKSQIIVADGQDQNCKIHEASKKKQKYYKKMKLRHTRKCRGDHREA